MAAEKRNKLPRQLASLWGGKCSECGLKIAKGAECVYTPAGIDARGLPTKSSIKHLDGECGSQYTIKCIYRTTSKTLKLVAAGAESALEMARKECKKGRPMSLPVAYEVYQGNMLVSREIDA